MLRAAACCQTRPSLPQSRSQRLFVTCSGNGSTGATFAEGQKVKVIKPVKVYHAPKHPDGLELEGMEGVVLKDATQYKGKVLSANFPFAVQFVIPKEGGTAKFQTHLGDDEIAAV